MKARCMTTLPPGDQNEFVSAVPLPDTVSKSIQAFVQEYFVVVPRLGVTQVAKSAHKRSRTFRKATEWGLQSMASTQS